MAPFVIGVDSGTQSTKTLILDAGNGAVRGSASAPHEMLPPLLPGQKEQDPEGWIHAVSQTIEEALQRSDVPRDQIVGIGISGQQHGLVALDSDDRVLRPAKLWCDTTTAPECGTIVERLGGTSGAISAVGNNILPGYTASKILWLRKNEPESYARLATVLLPHDYIVFWLTGRKVMEYGDASGTALMNVRDREWSSLALDAIDPTLRDKLPPLAPSDRAAGYVRADLARRWGMRSDVVVSGSGDNMMAAIGTGNIQEGVVTASLGTSGTIFAFSSRPVIDPRGEVGAFCDATGGWLPLVCTMNVTVASEMVRSGFGLDLESFNRLAAAVPAGSEGLVMLPFFEGERTPDCAEGTGVLFGLRDRTFRAGHLSRAAMEGATLGMNYGLNRLRELGVVPREIRLTGGGSNSPVWRQIAADVFRCPTVGLQSSEGAAFGAALHALWVHENQRGAGLRIRDLTERFVRVDEATRAVPEATSVAVYEKLQELFERIAEDLNVAFRQHRSLLRGLPEMDE
jgi:xylulokinase